MAIHIDIDEVKEFIQDKPDLNLLYDNIEQFSDDLYDAILPMVEDEIISQYPALNGVKIRKAIVIFLIIANLMDSEAFVQLRNQVSVADNNNNGTSLYGKQGGYLQLAQIYRQRANVMLSAMAKSAYYHGCWGSVNSNSSDIETSDSMYDGLVTIGY